MSAAEAADRTGVSDPGYSDFALSRRARRLERAAAVAVIRGTGAFARNHRRAERVLGVAAGAEGGAVVRLPHAAHDLAADALGAFRRDCVPEAEAPRGVKGREGRAHGEAAERDDPQAAPVTVADREDLFDQGTGMGVAT